MAKLKAIIAGATGLVGQALAEHVSRHPAYARPVTLSRRPMAVGQNHIIDFENLPKAAPLLRGDVLFLCLGTTRRRAGSLAAQRRVDVDYQYELARLARDQNMGHVCLISSGGADRGAASPYLRMKGELEARILDLRFDRVSIFQPSLLLGARDHRRWGEDVAAHILPWVTRLPGLGAYRPIRATLLAEKMASIAAQSASGTAIYRLNEIFDL